MRTKQLNAAAFPVHYLEFELPVEDYDARRLAVRGYAWEHLRISAPSMLIVVCDGENRHTWLAVHTPEKRVVVEYLMFGEYLLLEDSRRIQEGNANPDTPPTPRNSYDSRTLSQGNRLNPSRVLRLMPP